MITIKKSKLSRINILPSSKSYTIRYLFASYLKLLCGNINKITLRNVAICSDTNDALEVLKVLGLNVHTTSNPINDEIECVDYYLSISEVLLYNNSFYTFNISESALTLRFLIPLLLKLNVKGLIYINKSLFDRISMQELEVYNGKVFKLIDNDKYLIQVDNNYSFSNFSFDYIYSSEVVSGIMIASVYNSNNITITLPNNVPSYNYLLMTIHTLNDLSFNALINDNKIYINNDINNHLNSHVMFDEKNVFNIEVDYSTSANIFALALLNNIDISSFINKDTLQHDVKFLEYYKLLESTNPTIDICNNIDLGPLLFIIASIFNGARFTSVNRLINKESNRLQAMIENLALFGVNTLYNKESDYLDIYKSNIHSPLSITKSYNDHRIVYALVVLLSITSGSIDNGNCITKSCKDFFKILKKSNIDLEGDNNEHEL